MEINYEHEFAEAVKEIPDWDQTPVGMMYLRLEATATKDDLLELGLTDEEAFAEAFESAKDRINTYIELSKFF